MYTERDLEAVFDAVGAVLDDDGKSAPTTRQIAEHLYCGENHGPSPGAVPCRGRGHLLEAAIDGPEFARASKLLEVLRRRRVVEGIEGEASYFARDDEPRVTRWIYTRAGRAVARVRSDPWARPDREHDARQLWLFEGEQ